MTNAEKPRMTFGRSELFRALPGSFQAPSLGASLAPTLPISRACHTPDRFVLPARLGSCSAFSRALFSGKFSQANRILINLRPGRITGCPPRRPVLYYPVLPAASQVMAAQVMAAPVMVAQVTFIPFRSLL